VRSTHDSRDTEWVANRRQENGRPPVAVPRWLFHAGLGLVVSWMLWDASTPATEPLVWLIGLAGALLLGLVWLCLLVGWLWEHRGTSKAEAQVRWFLVAPAMVAVALGLVLGPAPLKARWALSRGSFQDAAEQALERPPAGLGTDQQRIGAYWVDAVQVSDGMVFFVIGHGWWAENGFVYVADDASDSQQALAAHGLDEPLGDGWFTYSRGVD